MKCRLAWTALAGKNSLGCLISTEVVVAVDSSSSSSHGKTNRSLSSGTCVVTLFAPVRRVKWPFQQHCLPDYMHGMVQPSPEYRPAPHVLRDEMLNACGAVPGHSGERGRGGSDRRGSCLRRRCLRTGLSTVQLDMPQPIVVAADNVWRVLACVVVSKAENSVVKRGTVVCRRESLVGVKSCDFRGKSNDRAPGSAANE